MTVVVRPGAHWYRAADAQQQGLSSRALVPSVDGGAAASGAAVGGAAAVQDLAALGGFGDAGVDLGEVDGVGEGASEGENGSLALGGRARGRAALVEPGAAAAVGGGHAAGGHGST